MFSGDPNAALREQVEREYLLAEQRALRTAEGLFDLVDPREPYADDDGTWTAITPGNYRHIDNRGKGEALPYYLSEGELKIWRDRSRELCSWNGHAINAKENRIAYVIDHGLKYKVVPLSPEELALASLGITPDQAEDAARQATAVIDEFRTRNSWAEYEAETLLRADEDGEFIHRIFHVGDGLSEVRFVEPEHLRSPDGGQTDNNLGVLSSPNDTQDVLGYWIAERPGESLTPTLVAASEVVHGKLNVRSSAKRGFPTFLPVEDNLRRADRLLKNCGALANVRALYGVIIKRKFSASAVSAHTQASTDRTTYDPVTGKPRQFSRRLPAGVVQADGQSEYEFPGANLGAQEYLLIYEAELRAAAARLNMPEYMLTANASNNNFASILVAESPASRNFGKLQAYLFAKLGDGPYTGPSKSGTMWRVLKNAVDYGTLPAAVLTCCKIQIEGPRTVVKDKYQETERCKTLSEKGLLSDRTWSGQEDLDYDEEQANRLAEAKARRAAKEHEDRSDKPTLLDLQKSVYARQIPREAGIAAAQVIFSLSAEDAVRLFPQAEMFVPVTR